MICECANFHLSFVYDYDSPCIGCSCPILRHAPQAHRSVSEDKPLNAGVQDSGAIRHKPQIKQLTLW